MSLPEKFVSIFARNCEVRRIDRGEAGAFLEKCHRYGDCTAKFRYGLYVARYSGTELAPDAEHPYPVGTLVAVGTFSSARRWLKESGTVASYEWLRYASLPEVRVIGGMGKILQSFIDEVHPDDVMSYAPAEFYDGGVYETLGFVREGEKTWTLSDGTTATSHKYRLKLKEY